MALPHSAVGLKKYNPTICVEAGTVPLNTSNSFHFVQGSPVHAHLKVSS